MRGSEIRFYADHHDVIGLLCSFNEAANLLFTETLSEVDQPLLQFRDAELLISHLRNGHPQASKVFLITDGKQPICREIAMKDGTGIKTKVDQLFNPDAVLFRLGGVLEGSRTLIVHSINTTGESAAAKSLFELLKARVIRNATLVEGFYVLPQALEKFRGGWRLTPDPGFSRSEDLICG